MTQPSFEPGSAFARQLDAKDDLALFRDAFVLDQPDLIYLDGNSLGRLPRQTVERIQTVVETEWGQDLIRGWILLGAVSLDHIRHTRKRS